jgi:hypothetical protein
MLARTTSKDLGSALGITIAGVIAIFFALRGRWSPQDLNPGIEGCLTTTIVGFAMALLHGMPFGKAIGLSTVTTAAQYAICAYAAGPATAIGITGLQLLVMGFVGMALALRGPHAARETEARPSHPGRRAAATHA